MTASGMIVVAAYLFFISIPYLRRLKSSERYYGSFAVGHRRYNWFWILCGLSATYVGGAAVLNLPSLGYTYGWYGLADVLPTSAALVLSAIVLAPLSRQKAAFSLGTFLQQRGRLVIFTVGLLSAIVYTLITAAQISALTATLQPFVPVAKPALAIVSTFGVIAYVFIGGYQSVTFTDIVQFLCMLLMYFVPVGLFAVFFGTHVDPPPLPTTPMPTDMILLLAIAFLFVPVSQDLHIRLHSADSLFDARYGTLFSGIAYLVFGCISVGVGVVLAQRGVPLSSPDDAVPVFLQHTFASFSFIPTIAILAVILSTLDAMIFSASTAIGYEVWDVFRSRRSDRDSHSAQWATVLVGIIALVIALQAPRILALILPALVIYVSVLLPLLLGFAIRLDERYAATIALAVLVIVVALEALSFHFPYRVFVYVGAHAMIVLVARIIVGSSATRDLHQ